MAETTMSRADALRALIAKVEAGHVNPYEFGPWERVLGYELSSSQEVARFTGSLDAVARLEAPRKATPGWSLRVVATESGVTASWHFHMVEQSRGEATDEARARLLNELKAKLTDEGVNA
jgi:hypothetical protein